MDIFTLFGIKLYLIKGNADLFSVFHSWHTDAVSEMGTPEH